jgi:hypothetical protein
MKTWSLPNSVKASDLHREAMFEFPAIFIAKRCLNLASHFNGWKRSDHSLRRFATLERKQDHIVLRFTRRYATLILF